MDSCRTRRDIRWEDRHLRGDELRGESAGAPARHPAILQVAVKGIEHVGRGNRLVAYYVARDGRHFGRSELHAFLNDKLPPASMPTVFIELDKFPLTLTGKLDRLALPMPSLTYDAPALPPRDEIERRLVTIWERELDVHPIGITDDFLELGGDSMTAAQIAVSIEKETRIRVPVGRV